jgi:hypothetical protein
MAKNSAKQTAAPVESVNKKSGEISVIETDPLAAFKAPEFTGITLLNNPLDWRCMVGRDTGFFQCNGVRKGSELKFHILRWQEEHGVKFSDEFKEPESVVQAIIVDENNFIGCIVFRTYSKDEFEKMIDNIAITGAPLASMEITARMEKLTTKEKKFTFHIVHFTFEPAKPDRVREIAEFVQAVPVSLESFRNLPKVV